MRRILKRFTGLFCVLALCLSMLPVSALAAEDAPSNQSTTLLSDDNVAKIEENEYPTLDEAVEAAEDGATIELLADATTKGWNLTKSLTITSAPDLAEKPTVTFEKDGIALWGKTLTFKGIDVVMNGVGSTPYGEWTWMTICASKDAVLALDNVNMTMDATGSTGSPHAIYFCSNNKLNLTNGSVLTIKNYPNDALEWDGGDGGYNVNITNSTFISDHNRSCSATSFLRNWDSILEKKRANLRSISEPARLRQPPPRSTGAAHARGRAQSIREERRIAAPPVLFALLWVRLLPALYGPFCGPLRPFGGCPWGVTPPARECLPPAPPDTRRRG